MSRKGGGSILLLGVFAMISVAEANCRIDFTVRSESGAVGEEVSFSAVERPVGTEIGISPVGLVQTVTVESPGELYRMVEATASHPRDGGNELYNMAYYLLWPCDEAYEATLVMTRRTGSAREVRSMWDSDSFIDPPDVDTARLQYSQALVTAEARHEANPDSRHQYDLIASYLALRAFNTLVKKSPVPLAQSDRLRRIANWHRNLLNEVSPAGLGVIVNEGASVASEIEPLSSMYTTYWNSIQATGDAGEAFKRSLRFKSSIQSEPDHEAILNNLQLTLDELDDSINNYAGRWLRSDSLLSDEDLELLAGHIETYRGAMAELMEASRPKLASDINYLSGMVGERSAR